MAAEPAIAVLEIVDGTQRTRALGFSETISDYWALTKPEVNFLILITTLAGFYLSPKTGSGGFRILPAIHVLLAHYS